MKENGEISKAKTFIKAKVSKFKGYSYQEQWQPEYIEKELLRLLED